MNNDSSQVDSKPNNTQLRNNNIGSQLNTRYLTTEGNENLTTEQNLMSNLKGITPGEQLRSSRDIVSGNNSLRAS